MGFLPSLTTRLTATIQAAARAPTPHAGSQQARQETTTTKKLTAALMKEPDRAAETLGHIAYFGALNQLATALTDAGNTVAAKRVNQCIVATTKRRNIRGQTPAKR